MRGNGRAGQLRCTGPSLPSPGFADARKGATGNNGRNTLAYPSKPCDSLLAPSLTLGARSASPERINSSPYDAPDPPPSPSSSIIMVSPQEYLIVLTHLRIVTHTRAASIAVYVYDYLLTFPREVSLIWPAPWNAIKVLFLLTRYLPFIDGILLLYYHFQQHPTAQICYDIYKTMAWLILLGMAFPEVILTLRTWAVWNRDRRLSICLPIFYLVCYVPMIGIVYIFLKSARVTSINSPVFLGCAVTKASHIVGVIWIMMFIYHAGLFSLMLIQGIQSYRWCANSRMFQVVFRDGLLYYIYIFGIALANLVVVTTVSPTLQTSLISIERVIFAIIGCRVVLDIRNQISDRRPATFFSLATAPRTNRTPQAPTFAPSTW